MKKLSITYTAVMLVSATALLAAAPAHAEFGIGINVGNLGFGIEARQSLSPSLDLRVGIAGLAYKVLLELLSPDGRNRAEGYQLLADFARTAQKLDRPINAAQFILKLRAARVTLEATRSLPMRAAG